MDNRVTNNTVSPIVLESGTVMAASGTPGSVRDNVSLSDGDRRRYVDTGLLSVAAAPEAEKDVPTQITEESSGKNTISKITDKRSTKEKD